MHRLLAFRVIDRHNIRGKTTMRHNILTTSLFVALLIPSISFAKIPPSDICIKDPYLCKKARKFINHATILQEVSPKGAVQLLQFVTRRLPTSSFLYKKALQELKRIKKSQPHVNIRLKKMRIRTSKKASIKSTNTGWRISFKERVCRPLTKKEYKKRIQQSKKIRRKLLYGQCTHEEEVCRIR
ncbi:MAG: hypothetical protein CL920_14880 [Deltaproteobacteria bacterium]|nr:hypothetical protein [Deltaproteobacteria bacterium]